MTIADQARNLAISLEAKKDALSQKQSGDWRVTFTVQEIDMDRRFTSAKMGTRYAMVLVEIGDDEMPVHQRKEADPKSTVRTPVRASLAPDKRSEKPKLDWCEVQPAAQASIRAEDPIFLAFLKEEWPVIWNDYKDDANECIRAICMVTSKRELGTDHSKRVLWHQLDSQFSAWLAKERVGA